MSKEIVGVILAGGKSRRMGTDKAFLAIGGIPLIEREVKILSVLFPTVAIVAKELEKFRFIEGVVLVQDHFAEQHALGGIYTALSHFQKSCFVFACDLPFLNLSLIRLMRQQRNGYDVFVPRSRHGLEPLHALYTEDCLDALERQIRQKNLRLENFIPKVHYGIFDMSQFHFRDPETLPFLNVNTPRQLQAARKLHCQT